MCIRDRVSRFFFLAKHSCLRLDLMGVRSEASTTRVCLAEFLDFGAQFLLAHFIQALGKHLDVEFAKRLKGRKED